MDNKDTSSLGLEPHVAAFLSYVFFTGIIFLMIEKENKYIRFHAWQSVAFLAAIVMIFVGCKIVIGILMMVFAPLAGLVEFLLWITLMVCVVFWIVSMVKAYKGEMYQLPIVGDIAKKQAQC